MKLLYITPYKVSDGGVSSGTVVSVKQALVDAGNEVIVIDNLHVPKVFELLMKVLRKILRKEINVLREPFVLKRMEAEIEKRSQGLEYDAVFSQTSVLCAYYQGDKPVVFYTDASFGGMLDYYWNPNDWVSFNLKHGNEVEKKALDNCTRAIYASQWAADSATRCYGTDPKKCAVINRGANIYHDLCSDDIKKYVETRVCSRMSGEYRFLFVGRNWERKGGPLALEVVSQLNGLGFPSKLVVIGCIPEVNESEQDYVEVVGFLNKSIPEENKHLQEAFLSADFYLQPSKQEAQGIAYTEASAFGLPIVATNTGGVSGVVTERNGFLLEINDTAERYVEKLLPFLKNGEEYRKLAMSTFAFYEDSLNWGSVGKRLTAVVEEAVEKQKGRRE